MSQRLTAEQLGLDAETYAALLWVRDALDPDVPEVVPPSWMEFDMMDWGRAPGTRNDPVPSCGTAYCIGGAMDLHRSGLAEATTPDQFLSARSRYIDLLHGLGPDSLKALFYRFPVSDPDRRRDPRLAVAAIDQVLAGNTKNPWLMPESRRRREEF